MDKHIKTDYIFQKKALLILLYLYYANNVAADAVILRSFGFHFDPKCNFKAIVRSKKEHIHKYAVHILPSVSGVNLEKMDIMGEVNILKVTSIQEDELYKPQASLNIYFANNSFLAEGFIEGQEIHADAPVGAKDKGLLSRLETLPANNESADSFRLWLMRFYTSKLPTDLVLGAGINKDYGAKDWNELVSALNLSFYQGKSKVEGEIKHYVGQELFTSSTMLQRDDFNAYKELAHELYEFKEARSFNDPESTLFRCVDFLAAHPGTSVITYNYDTNLEYLLKKRNLLYCTIYDDNSFVVKDAVATIYHVHGLLPYERYDQTKFTDSLVFNESDYYYLYNNPYSWNIAKQLHDFKFNVCFFLGISLTDPDMKRILELGRNYLKFNFIFMKKEPGYSEDAFKMIDSYFFSFDLIVIWVNDYPEIGTWLKKL